MTLSVLCGQMIVVGLEGDALSAAEHRLLASGERGGVVLFRRNVASTMAGVAALNATVAAAAPADLPPLVAVDQEGGRVMRLGRPALQLPPMRRLGDLGDEALVRRVAEAQARELSALGFSMSFAPVADVHTREANPIIGDRAFGTTPEVVARFAGAFADGLARGRVLSCAKHFPGHGDTTVDSHLALPRVDRDAAGLDAIEIAAFAALARNPAIDAMMTAHVVYPALDEQPATLSHAICTTLLRARLGFRGVLFSDDLEMKALTMPTGEAAVRAVLAGCDALLVCSKPELAAEAHAAVVREAERSEAFRARCTEALERGLAMRRRVPPRPVTDASALEGIFAASAGVAAELEARLGAGAAS
ncbi:MAG: Beta-hexosaminidase [Labilithrix sp.]|nr:Beta-hexosaminidase [Labilithrix sp.]